MNTCQAEEISRLSDDLLRAAGHDNGAIPCTAPTLFSCTAGLRERGWGFRITAVGYKHTMSVIDLGPLPDNILGVAKRLRDLHSEAGPTVLRETGGCLIFSEFSVPKLNESSRFLGICFRCV